MAIQPSYWNFFKLALNGGLDITDGLGGDILNPLGKLMDWIVVHKTALIVGGVVIVGGIALTSLLPVLMLPAKLAKGVAAIAA